jgi:hypothetical protein
VEIIATAEIPWRPVEHQTRSGDVDFKLVRESELLPGVTQSCMMIRFNEGDKAFTAPRHHHDFEQIRVTLSGELDWGQGDIAKDGWVSYFPAGAYYGPERMEGGSLLQVQWSDYWVTREQNNRAVDELRALGEFKNGIYTYVDSDGNRHNKDGLNAVWEHVYQRPSAFPTPKYRSPILMNPDAFDWVKRDKVISEKVLGRFTERDLILSKIRWDAAGVYEMPEDRTYCVFILSGAVRVDDVQYGPQTAVWSDFNQNESLAADVDTEAVVFAFPPRAFARLSVENGS